MSATTRDEIETRLLAGETVEAIAEDLGLDVIRDEAGASMVALPGYVANDGGNSVDYEHADSAQEAAEEYVADGEWGERETTEWVTVYVWRCGLRAEVAECAYCSARATAHDAEGDPACAEHAETPEADVELRPLITVIEGRTDRDSHKVAIEPEEPDCVEGKSHDWASPHRVVGGIKENPGVWGIGGGVIIHEACLRCGCGRVTNTWAQDMTDGEQGLTSVSYEPGRYSDELFGAEACG